MNRFDKGRYSAYHERLYSTLEILRSGAGYDTGEIENAPFN